MDYGFAPGRRGGRDRQDDNLRTMFTNRANTTLVFTRRMTAVRQFITHLDATAAIAKPIDDMLIGAHANGEGWVFIPMYPGQRGATSFETLEHTIATAAHSVAVPDALIGYQAGDPLTHHVHFKGCNIGKAPPFLAKFKEALGDHVHVTAPLHFHGLTPWPRNGIFEYMGYEFTIRRPTAFANRAAALAAFQGAGFTLIDGSAVPNASWDGWIPRNIRRERRQQVRSRLGVAIGRRRTVNTPQQFRVDNRHPFVWTITYPNAGAVPGGNAARRQALENSLQAEPRFGAAHPFPVYERVGYASLQDFLAGYTWRFQARGRRLVCTGRRVVYTVVVAVTDPANGNLVFNFYPRAGSGHAAITNGLLVTDADYFATA